MPARPGGRSSNCLRRESVVLGALIIAIGLRVTDPGARTTGSPLLFAAHVYYSYLDLRTSDSALGNGLYQGDASLMPALFAVCFTAFFGYLSISKAATGR